LVAYLGISISKEVLLEEGLGNVPRGWWRLQHLRHCHGVARMCSHRENFWSCSTHSWMISMITPPIVCPPCQTTNTIFSVSTIIVVASCLNLTCPKVREIES
jgi:hypothetical protein